MSNCTPTASGGAPAKLQNGGGRKRPVNGRAAGRGGPGGMRGNQITPYNGAAAEGDAGGDGNGNGNGNRGGARRGDNAAPAPAAPPR